MSGFIRSNQFCWLRRALEVKYVAARLVPLDADYFGAHVRIVFLDAVHDANVGFFSQYVPYRLVA